MPSTAFALAFAVVGGVAKGESRDGRLCACIALSRLVLLAHHPSDVVAGALVGVIGAMFVRYWFAARRLGFTIHGDGTIVALVGPSLRAPQKGCPQASAP